VRSYALDRRPAAPSNVIKAVPTSASVDGSGTTVAACVIENRVMVACTGNWGSVAVPVGT
jgi:hypothetical protein